MKKLSTPTWMTCNMPWHIKQVQPQLGTFSDFLVARGAEVFPPSNEWEVVRFKTSKGLSIIYTKKNGELTFTGEALTAWKAFKTNLSWRALPATKRKQSPPEIQALRKRDGDGCFFCLHFVAQEDESEEHLLALTNGGKDHLANKVLAHKECNRLAGHLTLAEKIKIHVKAQLTMQTITKKVANNG